MQLIQARQAMSRKRIAEALSLTQASITQLTNGMIEAGLLHEVGPVISRKRHAGPREVLIDIDETFSYLLGIDIEMDLVSLGIVTFKGRPVIKRSFAFDLRELDAGSAPKLVRKISSLLSTMLRKTGLTRDDLVQCGIGMVGREYYFRARGLPMPSMFETKQRMIELLMRVLSIPVTVSNNVCALAEAQTSFFDRSASSFLFVKVGPGIGSAIVLDRELYRGEHGLAGEIGSSMVGEGLKNDRSRRAPVCLEDIFALEYVRDELCPFWSALRFPKLFKALGGDLSKLTQHVIDDQLVSNNEIVVGLYREKMRILGGRIIDYMNLLDLTQVYLYFGAAAGSVLLELLNEQLHDAFERTGRRASLSDIGSRQVFLSGAGVAYSSVIEHLGESDRGLASFRRTPASSADRDARSLRI
ncbi:ROK family protein [Coriobacterium glomerans]|nr:ROK family protein [Coriobacterium glomerans]